MGRANYLYGSARIYVIVSPFSKYPLILLLQQKLGNKAEIQAKFRPQVVRADFSGRANSVTVGMCG
jgi:hypothetical protein